MTLVAALQKPELVAARDGAFDVQCREAAVERGEQIARNRLIRGAPAIAPCGVETEKRAAAAVLLRARAERQQRAVRIIPERRQQRDRFEVGLLPLALGLGQRQFAGEQPEQAAGRVVRAA